MKIRKNSVIDLVVKGIMVISFVMIFGEIEFNVFSVVMYLMNIMVLWFTLAIEVYYVEEGRK